MAPKKDRPVKVEIRTVSVNSVENVRERSARDNRSSYVVVEFWRRAYDFGANFERQNMENF